MVPRIAADAVLVIHLAFIVFGVAGGWLVRRHPRIAVLHVPAVLCGAFIEFSGHVCPVTPLEKQLRIASGKAGYSQGSVARYLRPVVYPTGLEPPVQVMLGLAVIAINIGVHRRLAGRWAEGEAGNREKYWQLRGHRTVLQPRT